jgi:hypothetical protein
MTLRAAVGDIALDMLLPEPDSVARFAGGVLVRRIERLDGAGAFVAQVEPIGYQNRGSNRASDCWDVTRCFDEHPQAVDCEVSLWRASFSEGPNGYDRTHSNRA